MHLRRFLRFSQKVIGVTLSRISKHAFRLSPAKFLITEIRKTNCTQNFCNLINEIVIIDDHLPNQVSIEAL